MYQRRVLLDCFGVWKAPIPSRQRGLVFPGRGFLLPKRRGLLYVLLRRQLLHAFPSPADLWSFWLLERHNRRRNAPQFLFFQLRTYSCKFLAMLSEFRRHKPLRYEAFERRRNCHPVSYWHPSWIYILERRSAHFGRNLPKRIRRWARWPDVDLDRDNVDLVANGPKMSILTAEMLPKLRSFGGPRRLSPRSPCLRPGQPREFLKSLAQRSQLIKETQHLPTHAYSWGTQAKTFHSNRPRTQLYHWLVCGKRHHSELRPQTRQSAQGSFPYFVRVLPKTRNFDLFLNPEGRREFLGLRTQKYVQNLDSFLRRNHLLLSARGFHHRSAQKWKNLPHTLPALQLSYLQNRSPKTGHPKFSEPTWAGRHWLVIPLLHQFSSGKTKVSQLHSRKLAKIRVDL